MLIVEGVPEEDILTVKREKIIHKTLQSIRTHGWLPDMFQQIIRGAKDFLQEMIFKFKLPPKPVPKIDLQEWKDMRKLMQKLQKQSQSIKSTQQEISLSVHSPRCATSCSITRLHALLNPTAF